ncbi:MAG: hypothetical protein IKE24_09760 [Clostridia bacterium]|nr:hypothetical protein [Clostridia bacterium]
MSETKKKNLPARGWNIPAAALALILTAALWVTLMGAAGLWTVSSPRLYERVALAQEAVDSQMTRIAAEIAAIGERNGFDPSPVAAAVSRESVEDLNRQVIAWWTGFAGTGELGDAPSCHYDLKEILEKDEGFMASLEEMTVNSTVERVETQVDRAVRKSAVMFRDELIQGGMKRVAGRVDLPEIMEILRRLPLLGGAVSLLLAGLIALLLSRRIQLAGQYIGGALSGCGLLTLLSLGLIRALNPGEPIGEASAALQALYLRLERILTLESIGAAAFLMIVGGLLMAWADRTRRKNA